MFVSVEGQMSLKLNGSERFNSKYLNEKYVEPDRCLVKVRIQKSATFIFDLKVFHREDIECSASFCFIWIGPELTEVFAINKYKKTPSQLT